MEALTTRELARACRVFMDLAYPGGPATIPANRRPYYEILENRPIEDYLAPAALAHGICQNLGQKGGSLRGWEFRLGSTVHQHVKLRIQVMPFRQRDVRVYSVDTHDGFHKATQFLTAEESAAWKTLVDQNRLLKHRIEQALTSNGFLTSNDLLQLELTMPAQQG